MKCCHFAVSKFRLRDASLIQALFICFLERDPTIHWCYNLSALPTLAVVYIHNTHCIRTRNIAQMWFIYVFVYMHFRSSCKSQSRYLETCVYKQKLDLILFHPITGEGYFLWFRIPLNRVLLTPARFLKLQGIFFPVLMTSLTQNMYWLLLISQWYNNRARVISTAAFLILLDNEAS